MPADAKHFFRKPGAPAFALGFLTELPVSCIQAALFHRRHPDATVIAKEQKR